MLAGVLGTADPEDPGFRSALDFVLQVFRGASLTAVLRDDARWERELIATTTRIFTDMRAPAGPPHIRPDTEETP